MMRALLIGLLMVLGTAHAATYYRDRPVPIPNAAPCMIDIGSNVMVNARMIQYIMISSNARSRRVDRPLFKDPEWEHTPGIIVQLPVQQFIVADGETVERLKHHMQGLLAKISECK